MYCGKEGNMMETGLAARVVKTLTSELKQKNHHVLFDNFTSAQLLLSDGIYACGTARKDCRGFPKCLKGVKLHTR